MFGFILNYSPISNQGIIAACNGYKYHFDNTNWKFSDCSPQQGLNIEFEVNNGRVTNIHPCSDIEPNKDNKKNPDFN
jgi:hypothetical protein